MLDRLARISLIALQLFLGATTLFGAIWVVPLLPPEWLSGTPFVDYTIPALALGMIGIGAVASVGLLAFSPGWGVAVNDLHRSRDGHLRSRGDNADRPRRMAVRASPREREVRPSRTRALPIGSGRVVVTSWLVTWWGEPLDPMLPAYAMVGLGGMLLSGLYLRNVGGELAFQSRGALAAVPADGLAGIKG